MFKRQLLTVIAKRLIPSGGEREPCPYNPSCPYSGPGWCVAPVGKREESQQGVLEQAEEAYLFAYIDTDASPWPCSNIRIGLPVTIEKALRELKEGDFL